MTEAQERTFKLGMRSIILPPEIKSSDGAFEFNNTSKAFTYTGGEIIKRLYVDTGSKIQVGSIGCGAGGIELYWGVHHEDKIAGINASDIVPESIDQATKNRNSLIEAKKLRNGMVNFFVADRLNNHKIYNFLNMDPSGIDEGLADEWYLPGIPSGGKEGTQIIIPALKKSIEHLVNGGVLLWGIAWGLSDGQEILKTAREVYGKNNTQERFSYRFSLGEDYVKRHATSLERFNIDQEGNKLNIPGKRPIWELKLYESRKVA